MNDTCLCELDSYAKRGTGLVSTRDVTAAVKMASQLGSESIKPLAKIEPYSRFLRLVQAPYVKHRSTGESADQTFPFLPFGSGDLGKG